MQAVFFKLSQVMDLDLVIGLMKQSVEQAYKKKGEEIIRKNKEAIDHSLAGLIEVSYNKEAWASAVDSAPTPGPRGATEWVTRVKVPLDEMRGEQLPVSSFHAMGMAPTGTTRFEKRCIATKVPRWNSDTCVQCTTCSFVCPHAVIRPFLLTPEEVAAAPPGLVCKPAKGVTGKDLQFRIQAILQCFHALSYHRFLLWTALGVVCACALVLLREHSQWFQLKRNAINKLFFGTMLSNSLPNPIKHLFLT